MHPCLHTLAVAHSRRAFSLLELLIVVAVLVIIAELVLPGIAGSQTTRVRQAARLITADLEYAQLASMGNVSDGCIIVFDDAGEHYYLARRSDPQSPILDPATNLPYITQFGAGRAHALAGVQLADLDIGGDDQIGFTSLGALDQSQPATITVRSGDVSMRITVDASTGEASVAEQP